MKDLFFFLLSLYIGSLIFGSLVAIFRFWLDVQRFHPKEEKEPKFSKREFEKSIKAAAELSDPIEKEVD